MSILIRNGTLVLPDGPQKGDLRLDGGKITELGEALPCGDSEVISAEGKLVFPGFIDTHTHFEMNKGRPNETADNWTTGSRAALAGGTTCVLDFAEPQRGCSLQDYGGHRAEVNPHKGQRPVEDGKGLLSGHIDFRGKAAILHTGGQAVLLGPGNGV